MLKEPWFRARVLFALSLVLLGCIAISTIDYRTGWRELMSVPFDTEQHDAKDSDDSVGSLAKVINPVFIKPYWNDLCFLMTGNFERND